MTGTSLVLMRSNTCGYASKAYDATHVSDVTAQCAIRHIRVIIGQVLSIATCGTRTQRSDSL